MSAASRLLAEFRDQVRLPQRDAGPSDIIERVGRVLRTYPDNPERDGASVESPEGLGATEQEIEGAIDTQVAFFRGRGQSFEWKTYADDPPADLSIGCGAAVSTSVRSRW
jgi:hypothetical protein